MLSKQDIENFYSRATFLPIPKEIMFFPDSVIATKSGGLALAATKPFGPSRIILTQMSDLTSLAHESIHRMGVLNERITAFLTPFVTRRIMNKPPMREIRYSECTVGGHNSCMTEHQAFQAAGIKSVLGEGMPVVKHLILIE